MIVPPLLTGLIIAAFVFILGAFATYLRSLGQQIRDQNQSIQDMKLAVAKVEVQVSPLWARIQAQIATDLHHPHPRYFEMDKLLEKLEALTILPEERMRLKTLLLERSVDTHTDITQEQRAKAVLMVHVMDLVLKEGIEKEGIEKEGIEKEGRKKDHQASL